MRRSTNDDDDDDDDDKILYRNHTEIYDGNGNSAKLKCLPFSNYLQCILE